MCFRIFSLFSSVFSAIFSVCRVCRICRCRRKKKIDYSQKILEDCQNSSTISSFLHLVPDEVLFKAATLCSTVGNCVQLDEILKYKKFPDNDMNFLLETSCKNNRYSTAETLVKNGANPIVGIRVATSINIFRMLDRYRQNIENIS